jgi:hypothetical protein
MGYGRFAHECSSLLAVVGGNNSIFQILVEGSNSGKYQTDSPEIWKRCGETEKFKKVVYLMYHRNVDVVILNGADFPD